MFAGTDAFNQNIGSWNTSNVTSMQRMFNEAFAFNNGGSPDINNWNTSNVTDMQELFYYAVSFNQNIGSWNVSKVTTMSSAFLITAFNNSGSNTINNWRPISCSNFNSMFYNAYAFNQPIGNWPLSASSVSIREMFVSATSFNQNIGSWNVSKVTDMYGVFQNATNFNNSGSNTIGSWDTSNVIDMDRVFRNATSFNQDIGNWNTSKVTTMIYTFFGASSFNYSLANWNIVSSSNMLGMLDNCGMSKANYSATLTGWASQAPNIKSNVTLGASGRQYDTPGSASRAILTSAPYNWTINGDSYVP